MKAITIDPVWAWAIMHGPKRVENRTWATSHRGPLLIHAGSNTSREAAARAELARLGIDVPEEIPRGAILGTVELVDVVRYPDQDADGRLFDDDPHDLAADPLATGPVCWILRNPRPLPAPIICGGRQRLWEAGEVTGVKGVRG